MSPTRQCVAATPERIAYCNIATVTVVGVGTQLKMMPDLLTCSRPLPLPPPPPRAPLVTAPDGVAPRAYMPCDRPSIRLRLCMCMAREAKEVGGVGPRSPERSDVDVVLVQRYDDTTCSDRVGSALAKVNRDVGVLLSRVSDVDIYLCITYLVSLLAPPSAKLTCIAHQRSPLLHTPVLT